MTYMVDGATGLVIAAVADESSWVTWLADQLQRESKAEQPGNTELYRWADDGGANVDYR